MKPRWFAAAVALAFAVSACASTGTSPSPSIAVAGEPGPWTAEIHNLQPDGTRSLDSALKLMAMAFGSIPGVDAQLTPGVLSATPATRVVLAHLDQLTADQRAAVERYTTPSADAPQFDVPPSPSAARSRELAFAGGIAAEPPRAADAAKLTPQQQQLFDLISLYRTFYEAQGAGTGSWGIKVIGENGGPTTWSQFAFGPDFFGGFQCYIYASSSADANAPVTEHALAHEVFHCFQAAYLAKDPLGATQAANLAGGEPSWIWEGGSEYAALRASGTSAGHEDAWPTYLTQPGTSLFSRSYDAVGFYAHLVRSGVKSEYALFDELTGLEALSNDSNDQRFVYLGGGDPAFLDTWASGLARDPGRGAAWDTSGPLITSEAAPRQAITLGDGDTEAVSQDAYTNGLWSVNVDADLVTIAIGGHARLSDGTFETTDLAGALFCVNPEGCQPCPDSPPLNAQQLAPGFLLTVSGGQIGASGTLSAATVDKDCETATPGQALRAHIERDAIPADAFMAGTIFDVTTCDGVDGAWSGYMNAGGLATGGQVIVPFQQLPITFTFPSGTGTRQTSVTAAGTVKHELPVPQYIDVSYPLIIETDGSTMSVIGINGWVTGGSPTIPVVVELEPAPPGTCIDE